jgi:hypothetical protein
MEQMLSSEATSFSPDQKVSRIKRKFITVLNSSPSLVPVITQMNPLNAGTSLFL